MAAALQAASCEVQLSYTDISGDNHTTTLLPSYDGEPLSEAGQFMPQAGIAKSVALSLLTDGMRDAAEDYGSTPDAAVASLSGTLKRFSADASVLQDPAIDDEALFWKELLDLMRSGAPQGNFYGEAVY